MDTLFRQELAYLSRRDFLKNSGAQLLGLFCLPFLDKTARLERLNSWVDGDPIQLGRATDDTVPVYDRPSFDGKLRRMYFRDVIFKIDEVTLGGEKPTYNRVWYRVNGEGYSHSGKIQPVDLKLNKPAAYVSPEGRLAEVTVPFTDVALSLKDTTAIIYRLYYSTVHWVKGVQTDENGKTWYVIYDDKFKRLYYAHAEHLRLLDPSEVAPLSPEVAQEDKRIEVWLENQLVIAYEKGSPALITKTATGGRFSDGDYSTPTGAYMTNRKRPSRHMASEDLAAANSYDLPGVPWVSYLTKSGISFHGTFWHNDFGKPRSHGCVNLSPAAAHWIYRWTLPAVPFDQPTFDEDRGTRVIVR
jgi:lipoprotein-anchoring transpeptidase ErfK/SrfK